MGADDTLKVYCDGGSRGNPGPSAVGFVIVNNNSQVIHQGSRFIGVATNNVAEYEAVIEALSWLKHNKNILKITSLKVYVDSKLVAHQLSGDYKVKNSVLLQKLKIIKDLEVELALSASIDNKHNVNLLNRKVSYCYIPREQNTSADALVNKVLNNLGYRKSGYSSG